MDRRTIIATAGAITLTVLAGSTAIAANVGILGSSPKTPVGQLSPVASLETPPTGEGAARARSVDRSATTSTLPAQVETIYVDEYVPASPRSAGSSGASDPAATTPAPTAVTPQTPQTPTTPAPVVSSAVDDDSVGGDDGTVSEPAAEDGESEAADDQGDDDEHESEDDEDEEYEGGEDDD